MKVKLTQRFVDKQLRCPEDKKQIEFCDIELPGLYVSVSSVNPGIGTFALRYKNEAGKTKHRKIGRTNIISLKDAREQAKLYKLEISQGKDPQAEVQKRRNEMTYGEFMEDYFFPYITPRRRSAKTYRQMFDTQIKKEFGDIKVNQISKRQVHAFHNDLRNQGLKNGTCNRYLQLIKSSINIGINIVEVIDIKNPAVGIPLFPEEPKDRYLNEDELARLMPILMADDGMPARIIRFLLATGLRIGECLHAEWSHIDIDNRLMIIPSEQGKSKKNDSIPLNSLALQIFEECDHTSQYPFANPATGKPYVTIKKRFKTIMDMAGLENVTAHTLRHTCASLMINAGRSLYDVQRVLRHSSSQVTERYAHLSPQSAMAASDTVSETLMRAASGNR